ncbi:MAG: spore germination protein [Clostridiales bacterium]|nr:spore germination protein [Clostridiales bacterium]
MMTCRMTEPSPKRIKKEIVEQIKKNVLAISDMKEVETIDEGILNVLSGETVLLLEQYEKIIIIGSRGWPMRAVSEPVTESLIRGPRDGFTETLRVNTALIRDYKLFAFPLIPIIYLIAIFSENIAETYTYLDKITNFLAPIIVIIIPCILAIIIYARKKSNREDGGM